MKLNIINPDYGMTDEEMAERCRYLQQFVGPDTQIYMECLTESIINIDSPLDVTLAGPEIVKKAIRSEQSGYDGIILYCFSDPAMDACREVVSIPVVGGAQAACLYAPAIGRQAGILLADNKRIPEKKAFLYQTGVQPDRISCISAIDTAGCSLWEQRNELLDKLAQEGQHMITEHYVQVIILGCLSFLGLAQPLSQMLKIPVIDPAVAAVSMAESLVRQQLHTSRMSYPAPIKRKRSWSGGLI